MNKTLIIIPKWEINYPNIFSLDSKNSELNNSLISKINFDEFDSIKLYGESLNISDENLNIFKSIENRKHKFSGIETIRVGYIPTWANMPFETMMSKLSGSNKKLEILFLDSRARSVLKVDSETYINNIKKLVIAGKIEKICYPIRIKNNLNLMDDLETVKQFGVDFLTVFCIENGDEEFFNSMTSEQIISFKNKLIACIDEHSFVKFKDLFKVENFKKEDPYDSYFYLSPISSTIKKSFLPGYYTEDIDTMSNYYTLGNVDLFQFFYSDAIFSNVSTFSKIAKNKYNTFIKKIADNLGI